MHQIAKQTIIVLPKSAAYIKELYIHLNLCVTDISQNNSHSI